MFAGYLPREDIHDAAISRSGAPLAGLPEGSVVGTSSVRRAAQLRVHHPRLRIEPLRGNVSTRLMRLDEGHFDVLIAAVSGLHRVEQADRITETLSLETMCPPIGAGTIAHFSASTNPSNDPSDSVVSPAHSTSSSVGV